MKLPERYLGNAISESRSGGGWRNMQGDFTHCPLAISRFLISAAWLAVGGHKA